MIEFKKYSSIENHFYKDYLDQVREQVPADVQWVVQENVKGKVDFPQIGFEKGTTERGVSKVSKSC